MRRNRSGGNIDEQLRATRPEPVDELTRAISDRVRPRRGLMGGLARVPLGPVGGLTAIVLAVVLALGGAGAALNTAGDATNVRKAKSVKQKKAQTRAAPAINQYQEDDEVLVCINGFAEHMVSPSIAATLIASGVATPGPCPPSIFNPF